MAERKCRKTRLRKEVRECIRNSVNKEELVRQCVRVRRPEGVAWISRLLEGHVLD